MPFHIIVTRFIILIRLGVVILNLIKTIFIILASVYTVILIIFSILTKKPFKALIYNGLFGLFSFVLIDLTSFLTGIWIPINDFTVAISLLGGLPGVILLIIARFLLFCV